MSKKMLAVAACGLVVCVMCLSAAAAIGGKALQRTGLGFDWFDRPRCDFGPAGGQASRSMVWNGGDTATINIPATVHYRRGSGDQVVVRGDAAVLPHIYVDDGRLELNCRNAHFGGPLDITLPGRAFQAFAVHGSGDLTLDNIDQSALKLNIAGSGSITARGRVDGLDFRLAGSGDGRFGGLVANDAKIRIAGSGNVDVAARRDLAVNIAGSGTVTLQGEPRTIKSHVSGSGEIITHKASD